MKFLWFFDVDAIWVLAPLCGMLWALGGSGVKLLRRVVMGVVIAAVAMTLGLAVWLAGAQIASVFIVTTLPYGDKISKKLGRWKWFYIVGLGALYGAALWPLALGFQEWIRYTMGCAITVTTFGITLASSQHLRWPTHKWQEIATGTAVGGVAAWLMV